MRCEDCGEIIPEYMTAWAKRPCGAIVCDSCCQECASKFNPKEPCKYVDGTICAGD